MIIYIYACPYLFFFFHDFAVVLKVGCFIPDLVQTPPGELMSLEFTLGLYPPSIPMISPVVPGFDFKQSVDLSMIPSKTPVPLMPTRGNVFSTTLRKIKRKH
jgi:hypothetical protein